MRASAWLVIVLLLAWIAYTSADCRSCCSPEGSCSRAFKSQEGICCGVVRGRPFCCPRDASCTRKSGNRYACSFSTGSGKSGDTELESPYRRDDDIPTCGFGCALALTLAFCFGLPCCCLIGYAFHLRRKRAAEEAEAAAWARPTPAPSYPPPVSYAPSTYGSGPSGFRAPPNTPVGGYAGERMGPAGAAGETWQGAPHRLADDPSSARGGGGGRFDEAPYTTPLQYSAASSYPTVARSPPPRSEPPLRSDPLSSITEKAKSWFGVGFGGHEVAEPERPVVAGQRPEGAPGGMPVVEPLPPPYAPR